MWRLELKKGEVRRVDEPVIRLPRGYVGVKVKAFLIDDFTHWALKKGEGSFSRWAMGVVVAGGEVGRYVVAYAENAAAQYIATDRFVYIEGNSPSFLETAAVAYVVEALNHLPSMKELSIAGDDPRRRAVEQLAKIGRSRLGVALEGAVVRRGRYVAISRLVEVVDNASVRYIDVPSRWALKKATEIKTRLGLPTCTIDDFSLDRWGVVVVE
ncbi:MAG: hypothetical protein QW259_05790 [Pyrobaculum sp.]